MKDSLAEIIDRLEEIRAKAELLGKEHEKFAESIAEAEAKLESARRELEAAEAKMKRDGRK